MIYPDDNIIRDKVELGYDLDYGSSWNGSPYSPTQDAVYDKIQSLFTDWTDYSGMSTIVGWSSYTSKVIEYKNVGSLVLVNYIIEGTSNTIVASFTVPQTARGQAGVAMYQGNPPYVAFDNGVALAAPARAGIADNTSVIMFNSTYGGGAWTASGTKSVAGLFIFTE